MNIKDWLDRFDTNIATLDDRYSDAFVGIVSGNDGVPRAVYDYDKMINILEKEGRDYTEAIEFMEYELFGYWLKYGPMILNRMPR